MKKRQALKTAVAALLFVAPCLAHTQPLPAPPRPTTPPPPGPKAPPRPQPASPGAEMLFTNEFVRSGAEYLVSHNRLFVGIMQQDGRFCVYQGSNPAQHGAVVRCAPSEPQPVVGPYTMQMRPNGNICINRGTGPMPGSAGEVCFPGSARPTNEYFAVMMNSGGFELFPGHGWNPVSNVAYWTMNMLPPPRMAAVPPAVPATTPAAAPAIPATPAPPAQLVSFTITATVSGPGPAPSMPMPPIPLTFAAADPTGKVLLAATSCPVQCTPAKLPMGTTLQVTSIVPVAWGGSCATANLASPDQANKTCLLKLATDNTLVTARAVAANTSTPTIPPPVKAPVTPPPTLAFSMKAVPSIVAAPQPGQMPFISMLATTTDANGNATPVLSCPPKCDTALMLPQGTPIVVTSTAPLKWTGPCATANLAPAAQAPKVCSF